MSIQFVLRTFFRALTGKYGGVREFAQRVRHYFWTEEELLAQAVAAFREAGNPASCSRDYILDGKNLPKGPGVYLRLDYWNRILSGGSYGHTCYVAQELNVLNPGLICLMGQDFPLLKSMGVLQKKYKYPWGLVQDELSVIEANKYYYKRLKGRIERLAPAYIYERLVLGSWVGARIAKELNIPYIVEFNGSELTMKRTFDDCGYENEDILREIEHFSLEQAALITVVSKPIMEDLVRQGMSKDRILVNPNGVDTSVYAPASQSFKNEIRTELNFSQSDKVIAFIGSFGGWHGIDVLAEALLPICQADSAAKFLLIGDGNFRHLLTDVIDAHDLKERVVLTGMVPQEVGARYLKAADIYVSPHSCHMDTGNFFGSPTKLFEYMAMGGGIVASDLEQIGQVLTPGLTPAQAWEGDPIDQHRAVLCKPADVDDFVAGVSFLLQNPSAGRQMGKNARVAVQNDFSWKQHVARIWDYAGGNGSACFSSSDEK
nr:glycosyltransferase [Pseudodesulfovibrio sp.]